MCETQQSYLSYRIVWYRASSGRRMYRRLGPLSSRRKAIPRSTGEAGFGVASIGRLLRLNIPSITNAKTQYQKPRSYQIPSCPALPCPAPCTAPLRPAPPVVSAHCASHTYSAYTLPHPTPPNRALPASPPPSPAPCSARSDRIAADDLQLVTSVLRRMILSGQARPIRCVVLLAPARIW